MLKRLLGWFGLGARRDAPKPRPGSATARVFEKRPVKERPSQQQQQGKSGADGDFNPYNTGKFDRSASWERISKTQR